MGISAKVTSISCRVTIEQARLLDQLAEREAEPRSVIVRRLLTRELRRAQDKDECRSSPEAAAS